MMSIWQPRFLRPARSLERTSKVQSNQLVDTVALRDVPSLTGRAITGRLTLVHGSRQDTTEPLYPRCGVNIGDA